MLGMTEGKPVGMRRALTSGATRPRRKEKKEGHCENCRQQFSDFDEVSVTKLNFVLPKDFEYRFRRLIPNASLFLFTFRSTFVLIVIGSSLATIATSSTSTLSSNAFNAPSHLLRPRSLNPLT